MVELKWRVEDHCCSKMAQLPLLPLQKYGEGWLILVAWIPFKSDIDVDRWYSSTYLHPNKSLDDKIINCRLWCPDYKTKPLPTGDL